MRTIMKHSPPNRLKTITYNHDEYFVDFRLKQLRKVDNPHDFINFADIPDTALLAIRRIDESETNVITNPDGSASFVGKLIGMGF